MLSNSSLRCRSILKKSTHNHKKVVSARFSTTASPRSTINSHSSGHSSTKPVAIVTGGSRGIGRSIAETLANSGYRVGVLGKSSQCFQTAEEINSNFGEEAAFAIQCDVANTASVKEAISSVESNQGDIHVLVNSAGITKNGMFPRMRDEDLAETLAVNLVGSLQISREVCKSMLLKKVPGNIIMIGSIIAETGNAGQVAYSASKAGLIGATRSMAKELGPKGIRTNLISPGFIVTDMTAGLHESIKETYLKKIPLGRFGEVSEISSAVSFILQNNYINGQILTIDGGLSL